MGVAADIAEDNSSVAVIEATWRDPAAIAAAYADEAFALALLSDGSLGRWSYLMRAPVRTLVVEPSDGGQPWAQAGRLLGPLQAGAVDGPPFQGGVAGLASYELGARYEASAPQARRPDWPDLAAGLYLSVLAFDHGEGRVLAIGRGGGQPAAETRAREALGWLDAAAPASAGPLAAAFQPLTPGEAYERAVAAVIAAIGEGEIFQANIARAWGGRLVAGVRPFDLVRRLREASPAPFAAYMRLPGLALVSNSPERFVSVSPDGRVRAQPIKGTRARGGDAAEDAAQAAALLESAKDRAENLMIVDLMRNDLSRVCVPGTVKADPLFALETYANVHHMVSTVTGELAPGRSALELMAAAFPPGSITGAPKVQAMRVIARHEPPRGPYCGSLFWAGLDGALDSSVLIRTALFEEAAGEWAFEARAGAGIVADSDPRSECEETRAKIAALRRAFIGDEA